MIRRISFVFATGALWGAATAVLEAAMFCRWYHVVLEPPAHTLELAVNYAAYAGLAAVAAYAVLAGALTAKRRRGRSGPSRAGAGVAAVAGAAALVLAPANFVWVGPLSRHSPGPGPAAALAAVALVCLALVARGLYAVEARRERARRVMRSALVVWVAGGLAWGALFGRYDGALSRRGPAEPATGAHKNVLFILTDTERRDFLDCYGASWHASPATDRVAAAGAVFLDQVAQSTWTLPSTASLLTGQFPSSHGAVSQGRRVSSASPYLPEVFRRAGYRTGAFTENFHILPRNGFGRGVDEFWAIWLPWVFDHAVLYRLSHALHLPTIGLGEKAAFPDTVTRPDQVNWDARATTDRALEWLDSLGDAPFFAYIHYMGPHGPYGPPEFLLEGEPPAVRVADHPREKGGGLPLGEPGRPVSAAELQTMKTLYAADIRYVEGQILRLLDWLDDSGRAGETIVVLTSDHGEEFYEHRAWNHGASAFDEVLRVPLVVSAPGLVEPGLRIEPVTRHIDVMPTILDLAGLDVPEGVQGRSLRALIDGGSLDPVPAYTEVYPIRPANCSIVSLVDPPDKLIRVTLDGETAVMLFDLRADPGEQTDVAGSKPEAYESLLAEMDVWEGVAHLFTPEGETVPVDPATLQRLRSLGYIN